MPITSTAIPSPDELEVLENVMGYASSELDEVLLHRLRDLSEENAVRGMVDYNLTEAGLPQEDSPPLLDDAEAGRLMRAAYSAFELAEWLRRDATEAMRLVYELSRRDGWATLADEAAYRARMAEWFGKHAAIYRKPPLAREGD